MLIKNSELVASAQHWNLDYLAKHFGGQMYSVFTSKTNEFKFWDSDKDKGLKTPSDFVPPTFRLEMSLKQFAEKLRTKDRSEKIYYQNGLTDKVGPAIVRDFIKFRWDWVETLSAAGNWGPLTSNLLLIGEKNNVTPVHYDEQENLFSQIQGEKRVFLFDPEQFECLYPYPTFHPHDRQSQVNLRNPDFDKFPNLANVKGYYTVLKPGDVLYIPMYWWHHVESASDVTISVTFWHKTSPVGKVEFPLKWHHKLTIMRNVEKMVSEAIGDTDEVIQFMQMMVNGRYREDYS